MPLLVPKKPGGQSVQADCPGKELYELGGHCVHDVELAKLNEPAAQTVHTRDAPEPDVE